MRLNRYIGFSVAFFALLFSGLEARAVPTSGAYVNDEQRFFVGGQKLNEAIGAASAIICYMASMRPDEFVNDGAYLAKVYEDRCETTGADSASEQASATATSSQSSTTASSSDSATSFETEQSISATLNVTRESGLDPVVAKVWVEDKAQSEEDIDAQIFVKVEQTAGVSEDAPNGEFQMWFSVHLDDSADIYGIFEQGGFSKNQAISQGYMKASGSGLQFKEFGADPSGGGGSENNIALEYLDGGDLSGIYAQMEMIMPSSSFGSVFQKTSDAGVSKVDSPLATEGAEENTSGPSFEECSETLEFWIGGLESGGEASTGDEACDVYRYEYLNLLVATGFLPVEAFDGLVVILAAADPSFLDGETSGTDGGQGDGSSEPSDGDYGEGFGEEGGMPRFLSVFYQFYIDEAEKTYCRNFLEAVELCFSPSQSDDCAIAFDERGTVDTAAEDYNPFEPVRISYTPTQFSELVADAESSAFTLDDDGALVTEDCYSTDLSDATRSVFRYGVYNEDGSRLSVAGEGETSAFPIVAKVTTTPAGKTDPIIERVFGFADYWGVFIDPRGRKLVTPGVTEFKKETFGPEGPSGSSETFTVSTTELQVEKRTKSFVSLNDLDKIKIALYAQDPFWNSQFKELFGLSTLAQEYEGYFDAANSKFVFNKSISFQPFYKATDLAEEITFTPSDWLSTMRQEFDAGFDPQTGLPQVFVDIRPMGVWSNDTRQWYDISRDGLSNADLSAPTDDYPRGGVRTETSSFITPSDLFGEELVCISECLTPIGLKSTFEYAVCKSDSEFVTGDTNGNQVSCEGVATENVTPNPFKDADGVAVGPFLKEDVTVIRPNDVPGARRMTEDFYLSSNELERYGFRLNSFQGQLIDYFQVDGAGKTYSRYDKVDGGRYGQPGEATLNVQQGLDAVNLNAILNGEGGVSPALTLDLSSAPAIGDSGTTYVEIKIENDAGLSSQGFRAVVPVEWRGTEEGFTLTVPAGSSYVVDFLSDPDEFGNYQTMLEAAVLQNQDDDVFAWTGSGLLSSKGRTGITLRMLSLFSGNNGSLEQFRSNLYGPVLTPAFFREGESYTLSITFDRTSENGFKFGSGPGDSLDLNQLRLQFFTLSSTGAFGDPRTSYSKEEFAAGSWWDGIRASQVVRYEATTTGFEVDGVSLEKGTLATNYLNQSDNPQGAFGSLSYERPDGFQDNISWGVRTGQLVLADDLEEIECEKYDGTSYEDHPAFEGDDETETRYCISKLFDSVSLTTYQIQVNTTPSYVLLDAAGDPVVIAPPRTLFFEVPEEEAFGRDGGKRLSLEYAGHGELRGIPGYIFDVATGENKGEFLNPEEGWSDSYRFINRFNIPDGSTLTDSDGETYYVKALDGEEWLKKFDEGVKTEVGRYTMSDRATSLVKNRKLRILGDPNVASYIGAKPTCEDPTDESSCNLINDGETAVVHGEVVAGADPTPSGE